jgi:hypothetical protein
MVTWHSEEDPELYKDNESKFVNSRVFGAIIHCSDATTIVNGNSWAV